VLGGHLNVAACADRSRVFADLINHLAGALDEAGVEVVWQVEADRERLVQAQRRW